MNTLARLAHIASVVVLFAASPIARAQEPESAPSDCGTELARTGQYEAAVAPMTRCLSLQPTMARAFNLAIVLRNAGQARRALGLLDQIERGTYGELPESRREALVAQRATTLASVATVVVTLPPMEDQGEISMDGLDTRPAMAGATVTFYVDPGEHVIVLTYGSGYEPWRNVLSVSRGEHLDVRAQPNASPVHSDDDEGWLIGLGIGGGLALVAGAIILGVVLSSGPEQPTCRDRVCIETLVVSEPLLRF